MDGFAEVGIKPFRQHRLPDLRRKPFGGTGQRGS
jgi:hypothetical protein